MPTNTHPVQPAVDLIYGQYACRDLNPLGCSLAQSSDPTTLKHCAHCGFPDTLSVGTPIAGYKSTYEITAFIGARGMGRLYTAEALPDRAQVVLKEYLLPDRAFNQKERYERKQLFKHLAGLTLADGRRQDMRLILPADAWVQDAVGVGGAMVDRCYLVMEGAPPTLPSIGTYATNMGPLAGKLVMQILLQILQTLICLHEQKFRLPNGHVQQTLTHGNLNLDTVLMQVRSLSDSEGSLGTIPHLGERDVLIYLCDPALWEFIFKPPSTYLAPLTPADDLRAVGKLGMTLLRGDTTQAMPPPPAMDLAVPLERFLGRLRGVGAEFTSAAEARSALLRLGDAQVLQAPPNVALLGAATRSRRQDWLRGILQLAGGGLMLLLGFLGVRWWSELQDAMQTTQPLCCIADVAGIPEGDFAYTSHELGTWRYVLNQKKHVDGEPQTFHQLLKTRQPDLVLGHKAVPHLDVARQALRDEQYNFLVANLAQPFSLEFATRPFAYDGLAVFVAFIYAQRDNSLPNALDGTISLEQLGQLYTGEISNWSELGGPDMPVKLYLPNNPAAVEVFEQLVLQQPEAIQTFRQAQPRMASLPPLELLQQVLQDFEQDGIGAISFAPWSQVYGQCSVYPLALQQGNREAVQGMVLADGGDVTPATNLCEAKGSYVLAEQRFRSGAYPLSYPLGVIYVKNNKRPPIAQTFAEILQTTEAQTFLRQFGLIPLQPLPPSPTNTAPSQLFE